VATGILLMFYYVPSTTQAYDRMLDLRGTVAFGIFLRNMHRWSADWRRPRCAMVSRHEVRPGTGQEACPGSFYIFPPGLY